LEKAKAPISDGQTTQKIRTFAKTPSKALDTRSVAGPHKVRRALTDACVQYQHPEGEGGGLEGEKREYRDVASAKRDLSETQVLSSVYTLHVKMYMLFVYAFEKAS